MIELLERELRKDRRPNDGLLHASSHFTGSLRHVQLEVAGAPQIERPFAQEMPLYLGTYIHELIHRAKRGLPYMAEVDVSPWMPKGWGGTADSVEFGLDDFGLWTLEDYKTTKGESLLYIEKDGAKPEHQAQASLYWYALEKMGLPMWPRIVVWYLPKNDVGTRGLEPARVEFVPLSKNALHAEAAFRKRRVDEYIESLGNPETLDLGDCLECWVTSELDPVQDRLQKLFYDRATETWDLKLVPHWSAAYCRFPDELCDCSAHGDTKIGLFDVDGTTYVARKGYEDVEPEVFPA